MVDTFPSCKDLLSADQQSAVGQGEKYECNHGDIMLYMANDFFFTVISTTTAFLSTSLVGYLPHCKYSLTCGFQVIVQT